MAQLQILTQFNRLIGEVKQSLDTYNEQVKNEMFDIEDIENNENIQQIYRKGERIFDQVEDDLVNLNVILNREREFMNFFDVCRENKMKLIDYKNEIINKMMRLKKNNSKSKEEYLNFREEWNKKRIESPDVKNRRECEEMLEEINEEKKHVQEMRNKMKEEKEELKQMIEKLNESKKVEYIYVEKKENKVKEEPKEKNENHQNKNRENYEKIFTIEELNNKIIEESKQIKETRMNDMKQIESWTGLQCGEILFDSEYDNWNVDSSIFDEKIVGKRQIVFLIEEEKGEKFGYYLNTTVKESMSVVETDTSSFEFNLHSNGRLQEPMKFEIKDVKKGGYLVWKKSSDILIQMGNIVLNKENKKTESYCIHNGRFNYHGISKALCGKAGYASKDAFVPKHFSVIQMKAKE